MTEPASGSGPDEKPVSRRTCMTRLVCEVELLVKLSLDLQTCIHAIDLEHCRPENRAALQSADALSQRLQCVEIAFRALLAPREPGGATDGRALLADVFLEDMRGRLLTGDGEDSAKRRAAAGRVVFF